MVGAVAAQAADTGTFNLELRYAPQESVGTSVPTLSPELFDRPVRLVVEDARAGSDPAVIGDSSDDDDRMWPVRATNSVVEWAQEVLEKNARDWGIKTGADAPLTVVVKLTRFFLNEGNKAVGSTYNADVRLGFELRDSRGNVLADGTASGDATRYGKSRSAGNSSEVLSDATKEAYAAVFGDPVLQDAWRGKPRAAARPPASSSAITPGDLLKELQDLKKKGFSTDLLINYVNNKTLSAPLTADDMVSWKEAGMPQEVIKAALNRAP